MEFYAELDPANEVRAMPARQAFHVWKVLHGLSLGPACGLASAAWPIPAAVSTY